MAARPPPLRRGSSYLTPSIHDDAGSIHSEADSDSEDDSVLREARTSADIRDHDRSILIEEEERDRMLTEARQPVRERRGSGLGLSNPFKKLVGQSKLLSYDSLAQGSDEHLAEGSGDVKREHRRRRREEKKERLIRASGQGEDARLLYEMEGGSMKVGSETGDSSDTEGLSNAEKAHLHEDDSTDRRRWGWKVWTYVGVLIVLFITLLVLGAWRLSLRNKTRETEHEFLPPTDWAVSNGTALFKPTTILISLDGFRASYLDLGVTPALSKFMAQGVAPPYMNPSFPSLTFPNHYTLITGLYPESHGIVANKFWDPKMEKEFKYTDARKSREREWWSQAEPLWVTAVKAGMVTAVHMWPGSEADISDIGPTIVGEYDGFQPLEKKLSRIFDMLDMEGAVDEQLDSRLERPQFIASYVPNIDALGHKHGPNSMEVTESLKAVDKMLEDLFEGIEARNLTDIVNIVIVSDHGMAESSNDRLIEMDKIIDMNLVDKIDGWPLWGIRPKEPVKSNVMKLHKVLMMASVEHRHSFNVYLRDEEVNAMPERWHFTKNERIAPLWVVPKVGWAIVTKDKFDVEDAKKTGKQYAPKGIHGYDHEEPDMRAIFAARGPAFKERAGKPVAPFQNTEVYNILCDSLYLTPRPNNGTFNLFRQKSRPASSELADTAAYSSVMSSPSSAWSSASTKVATSSLSSAISSASTEVAKGVASSTAAQENPLKKPAVSISSDVSSMSSAWESASSAVIDRPVISETPAAVITTPAIPTLAEPVPIAPAPAPADAVEEDEVVEAGEEKQEEKKNGTGGWWDWIKGTVSDAKDWVVGLVDGS